MTRIKEIKGIEVLDSRGNPTVMVTTTLDSGSCGVAFSPSGASTGSFEAVELRDNDPKKYLGRGVSKAVRNVNEVLSHDIKELDPFMQEKIDEEMIKSDGTYNKKNLGANAILPISLSIAKAAAKDKKIPFYAYLSKEENKEYYLPIPMMNILNGGKHAANNIDIQEFMIMPVNAPTFSRALMMGVEVYHGLKSVLAKEGYSTSLGDEGGFAPNLSSNEEALEFIIKGIRKAGYKEGEDIFIALDVAASEPYDKESKKYILFGEGLEKSAEEMVDYYEELVNKYPIISIEDGLDEDDWEGNKLLTIRLGEKIQLVGDDLFVTNIERLSKGITLNVANAILIKPNQIGTLTETIRAIKLAKENNYNVVISHRSGETCDTTIADLAVGLGAKQIKTGAPARGERVAKYNRLLEIENELGNKAKYPFDLFESKK